MMRSIQPVFTQSKRMYSNFQKKKLKEIIPWFPKTTEELDELALLTLPKIGDFAETPVPTFTDTEYRKRRDKITIAAENYRFGDKPAYVDYEKEENECWDIIWKTQKPLLDLHCCDEYFEVGTELFKECGYDQGKVPQLRDVNDFVTSKTGFRMRPTTGLLSSRFFLNGLAFKTFFCTQYIRHPYNPFYTPEPDVVHELLGHAPMFANEEFAKFSQEFGFYSLGVSDEEIDKLGRIYNYTMEFGICRSKEKWYEIKAYGAGCLSSVEELRNCMYYSPNKNLGTYSPIKPFDPFECAYKPYPITRLQEFYYLIDSFDDAKDKMKSYNDSLNKTFHFTWNDDNKGVTVHGDVERDSRENLSMGSYGA